MIEEIVRAIFFKNYSGDNNLNEALTASIEEIMLAILAGEGFPKPLPEIVGTIAKGKSRVNLFLGIRNPRPSVPIRYIIYFDHVRKAMLDTIVYMRDNYDTEVVNEWFRERFKKEHLELMSADMSEKIEAIFGKPANVRMFNPSELKLEDEFFSSAFIGILGVERFLEYSQAYNKCAAILRQCQAECKALGKMVDAKES